MRFAILLCSAVLFSDTQSVTLQQNRVKQAALANNLFALKLHGTFSAQENVFFSPLSVFTCLGMLYAGARGKTRAEIRQALLYDESRLGRANIGKSLKAFLNSLSDTPGNGTLRIANAMISERSFPVSKKFTDFVRKYYSALVKEADIQGNSEKTVAEINDWVTNKTEGRITKLIKSLDKDSVLVLLNAIYFRGSWEVPFDRDSTVKSEFYNDGHTRVFVPMMRSRGTYLYGKFPEYGLEAVKFLYAGGACSMIVLLPFERDGVGSLEKDLVFTLNDIVRHLNQREETVRIYLPRFKLEESRELRKSLEALGMRRAFAGSANFRAINEVAPLEVSKVVHKAVVDVNESGTEASGATYVELRSRMMEEIAYFTVDHPFLFLIRHEATGTILFLGRVNRL